MLLKDQTSSKSVGILKECLRKTSVSDLKLQTQSLETEISSSSK